MDERDPTQQPEVTPLPEHIEPTHEASIPEVDSTRDSDEATVSAASADSVDNAAEAMPESEATVSVEADAIDAPEPKEETSEPEVAPATVDETLTPELVQEPAISGEADATGAAEAADAGESAQSAADEARAVAAASLKKGSTPQGEIATEAGIEPAWYVIHCYSGYENKVRHNLEQRIETMGMKDRIFDVVIPTQEEIEVKEGKRRTVERHIFPGYVLVNMTLSEESWYVVRNTPGVTGFVGMGNLPTALRPEEVSQIVKRMESEAPAIKVSFKVGERVRIIDGPFNDFRGTVADLDMDRTKVRVMVSFFGRETPVELDFLQVEKA